jgi:hypothetical protein
LQTNKNLPVFASKIKFKILLNISQNFPQGTGKTFELPFPQTCSPHTILINAALFQCIYTLKSLHCDSKSRRMKNLYKSKVFTNYTRTKILHFVIHRSNISCNRNGSSSLIATEEFTIHSTSMVEISFISLKIPSNEQEGGMEYNIVF